MKRARRHPLGAALVAAALLPAALTAALCASPAMAAEPALALAWTDGPPRTAAPDYGDALFHFEQDRLYTTLTRLAVAQHFGRTGPTADDADALRGAALLAWGLHEEAAALLARLTAANASPAVRDRGWYLLALARQQRGLVAEAEDALAQIAAPLPGTLQTERLLLQARLRIARQDLAGAVAALQAVQGDDAAARLARFNLATVLAQLGGAANNERARTLLEALGTGSAATEEERSLRDRANLALGLAALRASQPREARAALQRVRLAGIEANPALLAYGWAAAQLHDPQLALVPWRELAGRPERDAAVLEAALAVPYALGELGAFGSAVRGYEAAAAGYAQEKAALDESIAAVRAGTLARALLDDAGDGGAANDAPHDADADAPRLTRLRALPAMPHPAHLLPLLAGEAIHQAAQNLRDLRFIERNAQQGQQDLAVFDEALAGRQRDYAERLPAALARVGSSAITAQQAQRDALAAEFARAEREQDASAYATPAERQLLQRVASAQAALARLATAETATELPDAAARLRRVAGALAWQLAQAMPQRAQQAQEALRAADAALAEARRHEAALSRALQTEPARQAALAARITALRERLAAIVPQAQALAAEQQAQLTDLAVASLQQQQQRLEVYAAQSRLAIAQTLDNAQFARTPVPAAAEARR